MAEKIVVFGAGATGRGHVGLLAMQAGFTVVFVDKKPELIDALRDRGQYAVHLYGGRFQEIVVSGYRAYRSSDRAAVAEEISDAALVLTAVFDHNLPDVAETIALGISSCARIRREAPLNCLACENMMDSSTALGKHVRKHLTGPELAWCVGHVGFPDCMISRVVPRPEPDPLVIVAENYNEWTARVADYRGDKPAALSALQLVANQSARLERKLFIHNGGHAVCGYLGFHRGHKYIHEAVSDPRVAECVLAALDELGAVVERKWGFSPTSIDAYKQDLCRRGAIPEMRDEILRVVRDPIRKLSPQERLVAPAILAVEYGLPHSRIVEGIVAALRYCHAEDAQSLELSKQVAQRGLPVVLADVCAIAPSSPLAAEIEKAWREWTPITAAGNAQRGRR